MGAAGKAFCSGHDLKEIQMNTHQLFAKCSQVMITINKLPQPVIAMVQGVATAAGCQLVASCDLAVASEVRDVINENILNSITFNVANSI
jgi:enoyl-CoA hydratase/carnithine racemase